MTDLDTDRQRLKELAEQDRQERLRAWNAWADEPVPMRLVIRVMPAVYSNQPIPEAIHTQEQAAVWSCEFAAKHRVRVCLVVSRRLSVWSAADGTIERRTEARPDEPNEPYMFVGNHKFLLDCKAIGEIPATGEHQE